MKAIEFWWKKLFSAQKKTGLLEWGQRRAMKMLGGMKHLSCRERQRELELFSLDEMSPGKFYCSLPVSNGILQKKMKTDFVLHK